MLDRTQEQLGGQFRLFPCNGVRRPRQIRGPKIRANVPPKGPCWRHKSLSPWCDCRRFGSTWASWRWQDINVGNPLGRRALLVVQCFDCSSLWCGRLERHHPRSIPWPGPAQKVPTFVATGADLQLVTGAWTSDSAKEPRSHHVHAAMSLFFFKWLSTVLTQIFTLCIFLSTNDWLTFVWQILWPLSTSLSWCHGNSTQFWDIKG